jgi:hypothetical protein
MGHCHELDGPWFSFKYFSSPRITDLFILLQIVPMREDIGLKLRIAKDTRENDFMYSRVG